MEETIKPYLHKISSVHVSKLLILSYMHIHSQFYTTCWKLCVLGFQLACWLAIVDDIHFTTNFARAKKMLAHTWLYLVFGRWANSIVCVYCCFFCGLLMLLLHSAVYFRVCLSPVYGVVGLCLVCECVFGYAIWLSEKRFEERMV